jgi:hypothetical protein
MSRIRALSAATALVVSALSVGASAQEAAASGPTAPGTEPATPAAAPPAAAPSTTSLAPADTTTGVGGSYSPAPTLVMDDDLGPQRTGGAHEPLLDTETTRLSWPNVPLLATGATVFGASYVPAIVGAAISDRGDDKLYIPVAGPWITLAQGPSETRTEKALLGVDGAVQGLGALMLVSSFFIPEKTTKSWYLIGSNDLRIAPAGGRGSYGLAAAGRF